FRWSKTPSTFPDYYADLPGARTSGGRTLNPSVFDARILGDWYDFIQVAGNAPFVAKFEDFGISSRPRASLKDLLKNWWMALKGIFYRVYLREPVTMGLSLTAQLLSICRSHGNVRLYTQTRLVKLVLENGAITGAILSKAGSEI